jgi:serum/glucocorticoid-regulated kinase 2
MKREISEDYLYFKTKNLNVEYFLTLPHRKVKELGLKRLEILAFRIKIDRKGNFLGNLEIIKCLGSGGFSKVYFARGYGKLMAIKIINKNFMIENEKQNIVEN